MQSDFLKLCMHSWCSGLILIVPFTIGRRLWDISDDSGLPLNLPRQIYLTKSFPTKSHVPHFSHVQQPAVTPCITHCVSKMLQLFIIVWQSSPSRWIINLRQTKTKTDQKWVNAALDKLKHFEKYRDKLIVPPRHIETNQLNAAKTPWDRPRQTRYLQDTLRKTQSDI